MTAVDTIIGRIIRKRLIPARTRFRRAQLISHRRVTLFYIPGCNEIVQESPLSINRLENGAFLDFVHQLVLLFLLFLPSFLPFRIIFYIPDDNRPDDIS